MNEDLNIQFNTDDRFILHLEFGDSNENTSIKFTSVKMPEGNVIKIGYGQSIQNAKEFVEIIKKSVANQSKIKYENVVLKSQKQGKIIKNEMQINEGVGEKQSQGLYQLVEEIQEHEEQVMKVHEITEEEEEKQKSMTFKVYILTHQNKVLPLNIPKHYNIFQIKEKINELYHINIAEQQLNFKGKKLHDQLIIQNSQISENQVINLGLVHKAGCFPKNTPILASKRQPSFKDIQDFKVNDLILSYNEKTQVLEEDRITNIQKVKIDELIQIQLSDNSILKSTANHSFLTKDGWKKYQSLYQNIHKPLRIGDILIQFDVLRNFDKKEVEITGITHLKLQAQQQVYHISVQKNHTFLPYGLITHNMQIYIKLPNKNIISCNIDQADTIDTLKKTIYQSYGIHEEHQRIFYVGKELKNQCSFSDYFIQKEATLTLVQSLSDDTRGFQENSKILLPNNNQLPLNKITQLQTIMSYNKQTGFIQRDSITKFRKNSVTSYIRIVLKNQRVLECSEGYYFFTREGKWKTHSSDERVTLSERDQIKDCFDKWIAITSIQKVNDMNKKTLIYLESEKFHNFYINSLLTEYGLNLTIQIGNSEELISLRVHSSETILSIKNTLQKLFQIKALEQTLLIENQILVNNKSIKHYLSLGCGNDFKIKLLTDKKDLEDLAKKQKKVILKMSQTQRIIVNYKEVSNMKIKDILSLYLANSRVYYCLLYGKKILLPDQQLSVLENTDNFLYEDSTLMVLKATQKFLLSKLIKQVNFAPQETFFPECIRQNLKKLRSDGQKLPQFDPKLIEYYVQNMLALKVQNFLSNILCLDEVTIKQSLEYKYFQNLMQSLMKIQNYYGLCYRGIIYLKFSEYHKKGDIFYWRGFASASKNQEFIQNKINQKAGTLFVIKSLTGKNLSKVISSPEEEIVFLPFTYFIVDNITKTEEYDIVQLSEMPTPVYFRKNIILWVDDYPTNNINHIKAVSNQYLEVVTLTSTSMAKAWMKEFAWILHWQGIHFKFISDMVREEGAEKPNYYAGIDLLETIYNQSGLTTKILIFCGNAKLGQENAELRKIRKDRLYKITNKSSDFLEYCKFKELHEEEYKE